MTCCKREKSWQYVNRYIKQPLQYCRINIGLGCTNLECIIFPSIKSSLYQNVNKAKTIITSFTEQDCLFDNEAMKSKRVNYTSPLVINCQLYFFCISHNEIFFHSLESDREKMKEFLPPLVPASAPCDKKKTNVLYATIMKNINIYW